MAGFKQTVHIVLQCNNESATLAIQYVTSIVHIFCIHNDPAHTGPSIICPKRSKLRIIFGSVPSKKVTFIEPLGLIRAWLIL